jgi:hypothetical protein
MRAMSKNLSLTFSVADYHRTRTLLNGDVTIEGINLTPSETPRGEACMRSSSDKTSLVEVDPPELERIQAVENRLVVFNPYYWHRVTRLAQGRRIAFLANLWLDKPCTFEQGNHADEKFRPVA